MPIAEALSILAPSSISQIFRGVVVVTRETGGRRRSYPTRSVWPSVIAMSSNRLFAITDYEAKAAEEPDEEDFHQFLDELPTVLRLRPAYSDCSDARSCVRSR
jgi:hypothetical protein